MSTDLIVLIQQAQIARLNQPPNLIVAESDSIVEVAQPHDEVMVLNGPIALEAQTMADGPVIAVALVIIGEARRQMRRHETEPEVGEVHPDRHRPFVASHTGQARLSSAC